MAGLACALGLVTLILFWPATQCEFIDFDDPLYVTQNPHVRAGLNWETWAWAWTSLDEANWHPGAWISHLIDSSLYGVEPAGAWGHHLTSLILHAINSGLALCVLYAYTRQLWPAALAAALYAWHPLRVESVVWVSERKDVLCALFFWLTLAAYLSYSRRTESWARWLLVGIVFALGLAAKPMLVTLPFVLLLLDYWPLGRATGQGESPPSHGAMAEHSRIDWRGIGPLIREKLPLFALVIASCVVTYIAQQQGGAVVKITSVPLEARLKNALVAYVAYLGKAIWPQNLAILYPYPISGVRWESALGAALLLLLISAAAAWLVWSGRRNSGWFPVGWFWYLGMLVPVIGLVQVGTQSMADRYTYLPQVGIYLIVGFGLSTCAQRWPKLAIPVAITAVLLLMGCIVVTRVQIGYWQDRITLYRHAIAVTENNYTAHSNLGAALFERAAANQDRQGVIESTHEFERALAINPTIAATHDGIAANYAALGDYSRAVESHRRAVELAPNEPKPANNFAWLLATCPVAELRDPAEAVRLAERACQQSGYLDPSQIDTLAAAYAAAGRFDDAVRAAARAIELARQQRQAALAQVVAARRQVYLQQQPFIEQPMVWPQSVDARPTSAPARSP